MEDSKRRGRKPLTPWVDPTERYNNDPAYREHRKALIREHARKSRGVKRAPYDASVNLNKINQFASMKSVVSGVDCDELLCFNCAELGALLGGYSRDAIYKWQRSGFLPLPVIEVISSMGKLEGAYTVEEVDAMMPIIILMQSKLRQLKDNEGSYSQKIHRAIESVRK